MPESYRTGVTDAIYWSFPDCGPTASLVVANDLVASAAVAAREVFGKQPRYQARLRSGILNVQLHFKAANGGTRCRKPTS